MPIRARGLVLAIAVLACGACHRRDTGIERRLRAAYGDAVMLNLPPHGSREAGTIYDPLSRYVARLGEANDPEVRRSALPSLLLTDVALAPEAQQMSSALRNMWAALGDAHLTIRLEEVQEGTVPPEVLRGRLLESGIIDDQRRIGHPLAVITRSIDARVSFIIEPPRFMSTQRWQALMSAARRAHEADFRVKVSESPGRLEMRIDERSVIAFEQKWAEIVVDAQQRPVDVKWHDTRPSMPSRELAIEPAPRKWGLVTISNGYYPRLEPFFTQPWNAHSADRVEAELSAFHPALTMRLRATRDQPLTTVALEAFLDDVDVRGRAAGLDLMVVYYVGHQVSWGDDADIALLMADASRVAGGDGNPGLFALPRLHRRLGAMGRPFALLVDGCLENDRFQQVRDALGFVVPEHTLLLDFGGSPDRAAAALGELADRMRRFGRLPSLQSANPVVLAAKPGVVAPLQDDPEWDWQLPVGPLAQRIYRLVHWERVQALSDIVRRSAEWRGSGEISVRGSASWSDFDGFARALAPRAPAQHSLTAAFTVWNPRPLGVIVDFAVSGSSIVYRNGHFELRRFTPPATDVLLRQDADVQLASTVDGTVYVYDPHDGRSIAMGAAGAGFIAVVHDSDVKFLGQGRNRESVIVFEGDATVGTPDRVYRLRGGRRDPLFTIDTVDMFDGVEWQPNVFYMSLPERSLILRRNESGKTESFGDGLAAPGLLTVAGDRLYCLDVAGRTLYRLSADGSTQRAALTPPAVNAESRSDAVRGFVATNNDELWLATDGNIVLVKPSALDWR